MTLKRREFCGAVTGATIGNFLFLSLMASGAGCPKIERGLNRQNVSQEENMPKSVKAVMAKVISIKGEHPCTIHKLGDTATFTQTGVEGKICIHALYSMLPAVFAMMYEAKFPWLQNPDKKTHACPDAANPLVYEIERIWE